MPTYVLWIIVGAVSLLAVIGVIGAIVIGLAIYQRRATRKRRETEVAETDAENE